MEIKRRGCLMDALAVIDLRECLETSLVNNPDMTENYRYNPDMSRNCCCLTKFVEISNQRLKVIVHFQSGGIGTSPIGDILEAVVPSQIWPENVPITKGGFFFLIDSLNNIGVANQT